MKNISIITKGPAMGHGFEVDDIMLEQVSKKINVQRNGVKVRFTHPGWMMTWRAGSVGVRIAGWKVARFGEISI